MNGKVIGYDLRSLQVELPPGDRFFCERGSLIYYEDGITAEVNILGGGGLGGLLKRVISGESLIQTELVNKSNATKKLMVAGRMGLLSLNLAEMGGGIICRAGYYVASANLMDFDFKISLGSYIGGLGAFMQKIRGTGTLFMDSIGTAVRLDLAAGQKIFVDEKSFVCMGINMGGQFGSNYSIKGLLGGEGFNMFQITGPGIVYLNSVNLLLPNSRHTTQSNSGSLFS